jgi:hypothetical protein
MMAVWRWMVAISLFVAAVTSFAFGMDWYPDRTHRERKVVFAGCPSWQVPLSVARHMLDVSCGGSGYTCDLPLEVTFAPGDITPFITALPETEAVCGAPPPTGSGSERE